MIRIKQYFTKYISLVFFILIAIITDFKSDSELFQNKNDLLVPGYLILIWIIINSVFIKEYRITDRELMILFPILRFKSKIVIKLSELKEVRVKQLAYFSWIRIKYRDNGIDEYLKFHYINFSDRAIQKLINTINDKTKKEVITLIN